MRPIKLELQAFGPFKDKITIDFKQFENQGLFLISGPTGSGKTTIFDALFYALYGRLSSFDRSSLVSKSDFADEETLCYVSLDFEIGNTKYTIYRQPTQRTMGKRNNIINSVAEARLTSESLVVDKINEIQQIINNLLGLTADQFKQIVLLPQGEFKQLLFSSSTDKEDIFRDLFRTIDIQSFTQKLKEETDQLKNNIETIKRDIILYTNSLEIKEELAPLIDSSQFDQVIEILNEKAQVLESQLIKDNQAYESQSQKYQQLKTQIEIQQELEELEQNRSLLQQQAKEISELSKQTKKINDILELTPYEKDITKLQFLITDTQRQIDSKQQLLNENNLQLKELNNRLEKNQEQVNNIKNWENKRDTLKINYEKNQQWLNLYEEKTQLHQEKIKSQKEIEDVEKQLKETQIKLDAVSLQLEKINNAQTKRELKTSEIALLEKELTRYQKIDELQTVIEKETITFDQFKKEKQTIDLEISNMEILKQQNIAGLLASKLKENEPCPVCGSIHHPQLASFKHFEVDEEELMQKQSEIHTQLAQSAQRLKSFNTTLKELLTFDTSELEMKSEQIQSLIQNSLKQKVLLENELNDLNNLIKTKPQIETQKDTEMKQQRHQQSQFDQLVSKIESYDKQIKSFSNKLKGISILSTKELDKLLETINEIEQLISTTRQENLNLTQLIHQLNVLNSSTKEAVNQMTRQINNFQEDLQRNQDLLINGLKEKQLTLKDVQENIESKETIDINNQIINQYQQNVHTNQELISATKMRLSNLSSIVLNPQTSLLSIQTKLEELSTSIRVLQSKFDQYLMSKTNTKREYKKYLLFDQKYKELSPLSAVASGSRETGYLSFERYVLASYFNEVLTFANQRLLSMTQDRYQLIVSDEVQSRQRSAGLDLEVFDNHTSTSRPVKTLSGGETFKASLALALGLSDVISQKSGGRQIDALFVDEGFGSLDEQSIDQAIETLMSINQDGRLVGIISHVKDLKDRITNQIQVDKFPEGSQIKIISL